MFVVYGGSAKTDVYHGSKTSITAGFKIRLEQYDTTNYRLEHDSNRTRPYLRFGSSVTSLIITLIIVVAAMAYDMPIFPHDQQFVSITVNVPA
jgi:hypothetical protein